MKNILSLLLLFQFYIINAQSWNSSMVQVDDDGCLSYPEDENGNRIPDFSFVGYKNGSEDLPTVEAKLNIQPIAGDNTAHIQSAIDQVAALPVGVNGFRGAVILAAGEYPVYGTIKINTGGVVLRGAGDDSDGTSNTIIKAMGNNPSKRDVIVIGGGSETGWKGQVSGTKTNITTSFVQVGSFSFEVADASKYQVGDNIIVFHPGSQKWVDALGGGGSNAGDWDANKYNIVYNRYIKEISGKTITIDAPVYNHLDLSLSQSYIYKYDRNGLVSNIGIENIRIDINHTGAAENHANNALVFKQVENAWAKNCTFLHFIFSGVRTATASLVTIEDCKAIEPESQVVPSRRYNFNMEDASNNILIKDCYANKGRHSYTSNGTSTVSGIVIYNCVSEDPFTSSEGHRHWTTGMLFDNWKDYGSIPSDGGGRVLGLYNRGDWGSNHGWSNAHSVAWNCDLRRSAGEGKAIIQKPPTAQNYAVGGYGDFTGNGPKAGSSGYIEGIGVPGLVPQSLYAAQLQCRLGKNPTVCEEVSASSHDGNIPQNVLDNDFNTRWSAEGDGEYLEFCLGTDSVKVNYVEIAFYRGDNRQTYFDLLGSADGKKWDVLLENQTSSGTDTGFETFDFPDQYLKYLKYLGHGNSTNAWNSINEFRIDSSLITSNRPLTSNAIAVFPNPTTSNFEIHSESMILQVEIFDVNGRKIIQDSNPEYNKALVINEPGIYFLAVEFEFETKKMVKLLVR